MAARSHDELRVVLRSLDGKGYKAYKTIQGRWAFPNYEVCVDHVQGDPFADPSRVTVLLGPDFTTLPPDVASPVSRSVGTACLLARRFADESRAGSGVKGTGRSGEIRIEAPGQEVLPQTAVRVSPDGSLEARFTVGLPASGRRILGMEAEKLLLESVPRVISSALRAGAYQAGEILIHAKTNEDAEALRATLPGLGLVAFVANRSVLPRRTGVSQEPLNRSEVVPFQSPPELEVEVTLPNAGVVSGMGIPAGVTLIVGGGFHGKSTLLKALERGVYNHRPGDGREQVVSVETTVKIRAEDGRSVKGVDISPFVRELPTGQSTSAFDTTNASGSTSQAANIIEAIEAGARVLLVDEDTAATNFMIRDRRMQALIPTDKEPITPYVDRIRELYQAHSISSILVLGGSGDYLEVADTVLALKDYQVQEVTPEAKAIAESLPTGRSPEGTTPMGGVGQRIPLPSSLNPRRGRREESLKIRGTDQITLGREDIDLGGVDQIISRAQLQSIGRALLLVWRNLLDGDRSIEELLDRVEERIQEEGLDALDGRMVGNLAWFRRFELAAALNRARTLQVSRLDEEN